MRNPPARPPGGRLAPCLQIASHNTDGLRPPGARSKQAPSEDMRNFMPHDNMAQLRAPGRLPPGDEKLRTEASHGWRQNLRLVHACMYR